MNTTHSIHLELRIDGAAPTGFASIDGGAPRAFSGWVGLVRAVDELVEEADRADPAVTSGTYGGECSSSPLS